MCDVIPINNDIIIYYKNNKNEYWDKIPYKNHISHLKLI